MKKVLIIGVVIILIVGAIFFFSRGNGSETLTVSEVAVSRGTISEKALAVGTIQPDMEIKVKSTISGIISEVYFKIGDTIEKGKPLFKISPNPTPLEYIESKRNMELAQIGMQQLLKEKERQVALFKDQLISGSAMDDITSRFNELNLKYKIARERLELLEKGRLTISEKNINSIINAPISGVVLSQEVFMGDPVVPLTNYQPGTELCAIANMENMRFKGTVDEIDVGKLSVGMPVEINIGALPGTTITGELLRLAPKAKKDGNATLFDIEIAITDSTGKLLRAGYSATAYIVIQEKKDVLTIPERLLIFEKDQHFVEIKNGEKIDKIEVKTGLSDSMNIEIIEGLQEGQKIVERPPREIK